MNIPEAWKLVPVEPTEEMVKAGIDTPCVLTGDDEVDQPQDYKNMYAAMLDVAPEPPQADAQPAALPERKGTHLHFDSLMPTFSKGWNACLDEIAKLGPLYTHADAADVVNWGVVATKRQAIIEELREEVQKLNISHEGSNALAASLQKQNETLHAQLAKALELAIQGEEDDTHAGYGLLVDALSASAEPNKNS